MLLKPGEILENRYQVVRRIAQGGFGTIYKAMHLSLKRPVAIKVVSPRLTSDSDAKERVLLEAQSLRDCVHPTTIKYLDFVKRDDRGRTFLVMEYIQGKSIHELLQQGPLPLEQIGRLIPQLVGSLHEAHLRGIVHRDLKPDNLMIVDAVGVQDFLKVIDFGLVKINKVKRVESTLVGLRKLTQAGTFLGTAGYSAPEGVLGLTDIDARFDVYSCGVILFEMLTGQRLFPVDEKQPLQQQKTIMMFHHVSMQPRRPSAVNPTLPKTLDTVVLKALEKERDRRYQTMLAFGDAFSMALEMASFDDLSTVRVHDPGTPLFDGKLAIEFPDEPAKPLDPIGVVLSNLGNGRQVSVPAINDDTTNPTAHPLLAAGKHNISDPKSRVERIATSGPRRVAAPVSPDAMPIGQHRRESIEKARAARIRKDRLTQDLQQHTDVPRSRLVWAMVVSAAVFLGAVIALIVHLSQT